MLVGARSIVTGRGGACLGCSVTVPVGARGDGVAFHQIRSKIVRPAMKPAASVAPIGLCARMSASLWLPSSSRRVRKRAGVIPKSVVFSLLSPSRRG